MEANPHIHTPGAGGVPSRRLGGLGHALTPHRAGPPRPPIPHTVLALCPTPPRPVGRPREVPAAEAGSAREGGSLRRGSGPAAARPLRRSPHSHPAPTPRTGSAAGGRRPAGPVGGAGPRPPSRPRPYLLPAGRGAAGASRARPQPEATARGRGAHPAPARPAPRPSPPSGQSAAGTTFLAPPTCPAASPMAAEAGRGAAPVPGTAGGAVR